MVWCGMWYWSRSASIVSLVTWDLEFSCVIRLRSQLWIYGHLYVGMIWFGWVSMGHAACAMGYSMAWHYKVWYGTAGMICMTGMIRYYMVGMVWGWVTHRGYEYDMSGLSQTYNRLKCISPMPFYFSLLAGNWLLYWFFQLICLN